MRSKPSNPFTKTKIVYSEGILAHSRHNPRVIDGSIPLTENYIMRQEWTRWKYYAELILDRWMGFISRKVPGAAWLVFETYERNYYPVFRENSCSRPIRIPFKDAAPHWQKRVEERNRGK